MNPTRQLHRLGQSIWLDNITRSLLDDGTIQSYIDKLSVTGLTSNPSIFEKAIVGSNAYDKAIAASSTNDSEELFKELALDDLGRAAELFAAIHRDTNGIDGWVSLEVSPELVDDAKGTIAAAQELSSRAGRDNLFIKIPGTQAGLVAIEESIFFGIPINVTLLFSRDQYLAAAEAYLRGIERRLDAGLDPSVGSVASVFVSRWDVAVADSAPTVLRTRLGIAVATRAWLAYRELLATDRWKNLADAGAKPQRLLFASTSTKDPDAPDTLYVESLAAPETINTIPDKTLKAFADHGKLDGALATGSSDEAAAVVKGFIEAGVDVDKLAERLQQEGADAFADSWSKLMQGIAAERKRLRSSKASDGSRA